MLPPGMADAAFFFVFRRDSWDAGSTGETYVLQHYLTVTGTAAPPRLWRSAERDSHFDLLMRGALIPCIRPGMMPTLISVSR